MDSICVLVKDPTIIVATKNFGEAFLVANTQKTFSPRLFASCKNFLNSLPFNKHSLYFYSVLFARKLVLLLFKWWARREGRKLRFLNEKRLSVL